jgi:nucleotide-binding universal stress UspA family protein
LRSRARSSSLLLLLLHAVRSESASHPARVAAQAERVRRALGPRGSVRVEPGAAHTTIRKVADEERATPLVLSSRHKSGVRALASVSERVVHRAGCSVLLMRPEDLPA